MSRRLSQLAVVVAAVLISTSCSSPTPIVEVSQEARVGDLISDGYSVQVSNCVAGLGTGLRSSDSRSELIRACERAEEMLNAPEEIPDDLPFTGPVAYGDDPELDELWDRCEAGEGIACDELWSAAPIGSEYERFGVTCGEREEILNCSDLPPQSADTQVSE
ncbi:MAG: hypothetical protein KJN63_04870 [Acidimicrobiia bacterium]|nr:hypothetical protein [Acidimicrobiia bacterium]